MEMEDAPSRESRRPDPFAVRDRVLRYLAGVEMNDVDRLELAAECLRRAGPGANHAAAMEELDRLFAERSLVLRGFSPERRSFPPLNRRAMVSRKMEAFSFSSGLARLIRRVAGLIGRKASPPAEREGT